MNPAALISVIALALSLLFSCGRNPVTGKSELQLVSESQEIRIGEQNYLASRQSQGGDYNVDAELTAYVRGIGDKLAKVSDRKDLPYEFVVLNNSVPNAWALPGGKIALNRGLLLELNNEAELAAVIGHEIVHAAARHGAKSMERGMLLQIGVVGLGAAAGGKDGGELLVGAGVVGAQLISTRYGREAELESDKYGMTTMARAGYDPRAAISLQETFVRLSKGDKSNNWLTGLFASHPPSQERVDENRKTAAKLNVTGQLGAEAYLARIAHLKTSAPAYAKLDEGYRALSKNQADKALTLANEAIKIEPREAQFYGLRADAYALTKKTKEALTDYDAAIGRNADYFLFYLQRGLLKNQLGDPGARADLEKSVALLPTAPAHHALGEDALKRGARDDARGHFTAAAQSDSEVGKRSAIQLARIELAEKPEKYISVEATRNARGFVEISVQNRAPLKVRNVKVAVALFDAAGKVSLQDSVTLAAVLDARQIVTESTRVGPLPSDRELRQVRVKVFSAEIAD